MRRVRTLLVLILSGLLLLSGCAPGAEGPGGSGASLPILMFHDVTEDEAECGPWTITTGQLRETLQWLSDHGYTTVLPRELAGGAPLPDRAVLLSFDDGYAHMLDLALPILREYGAKAVISVVVSYVEDQPSVFLDWEMCRELTDSGLVEIGSHSYALHDPENCLGRLPGEDESAYQARVFPDLQASIDEISANVGAEVRFFAYPNGSADPWADSFLRDHFSMTVTTEYGVADLSGGLYDLPRLNISPNSPVSEALPRAQFRQFVKGLLPLAVILLMLALVVAALGLVRLLGRGKEKAETAPAAVLSKRSATQARSRIYQTPATVYFAAFRLEDGRELELPLEGADFAALKEGARGTLTWRGREFLRFREED